VRFLVYLLAFGAFVVSLALTTMLKRVALSTGLIDVPNERSSHSVPVPRGGGLAIVISSVAAMGLLAGLGEIPIPLALALCGGGVAVAAVGFLDDRGSLSPGKRLLVHFAAAAWATAWVGHASELRVGVEVIRLGVAGYAISAIGIVWFLNIFNFMDGIDGIAASEAIFICGAAVLLSGHSGGGDIATAAAAIGAATVGFIVWNWPPARIFMGDVGSGYLGFVIAVLALADDARNPSALWTWLILAGVFVVDSTITLIGRMLRRQQITVAHRTHAYQHLARKAGHATVTTWVAVVNVVWLLPCALFSTVRPAYAFLLALLALCPLGVSAIVAGAGQPEAARRGHAGGVS